MHNAGVDARLVVVSFNGQQLLVIQHKVVNQTLKEMAKQGL
jgi:stress-induced morphogen